MAVAQEYIKGNTHITIRDDGYRELTGEQLDKRREEARIAIAAIIRRCAVGGYIKKTKE